MAQCRICENAGQCERVWKDPDVASVMCVGYVPPRSAVRIVLYGEWIEEPPACNGNLMVRCSACNRMFSEGVQIGMVRNFCPGCGADMRERNEE